MNGLSLLIKPASCSCDMRCRYCFYADVADSRDVRNYGFMTDSVMEAVIRKALAAPDQVCTFGFQGGEPTLAGLDFFRRFVDSVRRHNAKNLQIHYTLQTNGQTIDDDWAAFLAENKFLTGVSVDAAKQMHDQNRLNAAGKPTHSRAVETTRILRKHGAEFNILTVVSRALARHPDRTYRFYKERDFRHLQFIPCLGPMEGGDGRGPHSPDAGTYGKFLCRVFDLWFRDLSANEYYSIRMFDNYVHMLAGHPPEICAMAGRCQPYLLVEADGTTFPCDFYAVDEYRIGNILNDDIETMLASPNATRFAEESRHVHEDCMGCPVFLVCRGGCRRDREPAVGGIPGKNVYCESYRMLLGHALPRLQFLAERMFS